MNETELLFTELLKCDRATLYLDKDRRLDQSVSMRLSKVLKRRIACEPIQYILGKAEFMGLEFKVTPDVLIPRPETEILVEKVLDLALPRLPSHPDVRILDIGTGSGNIAVSLAKYIEHCRVVAMDVSAQALAVARKNALLHKVQDRVTFIKHNIRSEEFGVSSALSEKNYERSKFRMEKKGNLGVRSSPACRTGRELGHFDFIVSNPPYIPSGEIAKLQPEIHYEPRVALDAGSDGLNFFRCIIGYAESHLEEGGLLIMEIGFGQARAVQSICSTCAGLEVDLVMRDYSNIERVIVIRRKMKNG